MSLWGAKAIFAAVTALAAVMVLIDQGDFFSVTSGTDTYWLAAYPFLGLVGALFLYVLPLGLGMVARWITNRRYRANNTAMRMATSYIHGGALVLSGGVTTLLTAAVSILREESPHELLITYSPWMSAVVMLLFGICVFAYTWSLPYRDRMQTESIKSNSRRFTNSTIRGND